MRDVQKTVEESRKVKLLSREKYFALQICLGTPTTEAANGGVLQSICSASRQKAKIRNVARRLIMFEERFSGCFHGFFQNLVEHHQNFS